MEDWFKKLFIDEAKSVLNSKDSLSPAQIEAAVNKYLGENPVSNVTASIKDNVLVIE